MSFLCKSDGQICGIKNIIPYDVLQAIGFNGGGVCGQATKRNDQIPTTDSQTCHTGPPASSNGEPLAPVGKRCNPL